MPRIRYRGRFKGKRRASQRRRFRRSRRYTQKVPRNVPFAPRCLVRFRYSEDLARVLTTGTVDDYQYNLNSIYDPNRTGTGHQPMGHDNYAAIYDRYRVYAVSWRITFPPTSDMYHVTVVPTNSATSYSDHSLACETPRAQTKSLGWYGGTSAVLKGKIYLPALIGSTTTQYKADDRFQANFGTSPTESTILHIVTYNPSSGSITVRPNVQLFFHTELFDPIQLGQS